MSSTHYYIRHMPHTLYNVPVCQQYILTLDQFAKSVSVNHEAVGVTLFWIDLKPCTTHKQPPIQQ